MRKDIYETVTNRVLHDLENGIAPWARPWTSKGSSITLPRNGRTHRPYSGVNILLLWASLDDHGFADNRWMTFNQARDVGATVRRGERGTMIVYADRFVSASEKAKASIEGRDERSSWFLKAHHVFNVAQIDGLEVEREDVREIEPCEFVREMRSRSPARLQHGGDKAFYSPTADIIQMPGLDQFADQSDYGRTLAHEMVHSTGHATRLNREFGKRFADPFYAREELVAEMGAAFISAALGVEPVTRHADYIGHWLSVLREDNRAIVQAASLASRAADYILRAA